VFFPVADLKINFESLTPSKRTDLYVREDCRPTAENFLANKERVQEQSQSWVVLQDCANGLSENVDFYYFGVRCFDEQSGNCIFNISMTAHFIRPLQIDEESDPTWVGKEERHVFYSYSPSSPEPFAFIFVHAYSMFSSGQATSYLQLDTCPTSKHNTGAILEAAESDVLYGVKLDYYVFNVSDPVPGHNYYFVIYASSNCPDDEPCSVIQAEIVYQRQDSLPSVGDISSDPTSMTGLPPLVGTSAESLPSFYYTTWTSWWEWYLSHYYSWAYLPSITDPTTDYWYYYYYYSSSSSEASETSDSVSVIVPTKSEPTESNHKSTKTSKSSESSHEHKQSDSNGGTSTILIVLWVIVGILSVVLIVGAVVLGLLAFRYYKQKGSALYMSALDDDGLRLEDGDFEL